MKILCFGASNVWGFVPGSFDPTTGQAQQYPLDKRWTGVLAHHLPDCEIIQSGLNGRTTAFEDNFAQKPYRNGLAHLPVVLESNPPLDWVIFFLGSNDLKIQLNKSVEDSAEGMRQLVSCVRKSKMGPEGRAPQILMMAPQPLGAGYSTLYCDERSLEKSYEIIDAFKEVAQKNQCLFMDTSKVVTSSPIDGVHLEVEGHQALGEAVADLMKNVIAEQ